MEKTERGQINAAGHDQTIDIQTRQDPTLFERDRFAAMAGITIVESAPGYARCRMLAGPQHLNSLNILHGGAIFSLADFAFAVASNSGDRASVAINASISYLKAGGTGEYYAEAREVSRQDKLAAYDVRVSDQQGQVIALFHGLAYRKNFSLAQAIAQLPQAD